MMVKIMNFVAICNITNCFMLAVHNTELFIYIFKLAKECIIIANNSAIPDVADKVVVAILEYMYVFLGRKHVYTATKT